MDVNSLLSHALERQITVEFIAQLGDRGRYFAESKRILIRDGMSARVTRCTLAHELGHHHFNDQRSTPFTEARAWLFAAQTLVSPAEYALAERIHDGCTFRIAYELDVVREVITAWQTHLKQASRNTYGNHRKV